MRRIDELIWHCTATPAGREVTVAEIDRWHKARGWSGIGYHKLVHLDGSVSEGRPESKIGAHVAGRNSRTLGYVYAGGVDAANKKRARDTRTPAQKATMLRLTREAVERHGLTRISGHNEYANKACPCFPARAEYAHLLNLPLDGMPEIDPGTTTRSIVTSKTANASTAVSGYGGYEAGSEVWGAVDHVSRAKGAAQELGLLDQSAGVISTIASSPRFWIGVVLVAIGLFIWWDRKRRLEQENG